MKTKFKKRHILTAALALLMASAIAINWFYSKNPVMPADNTGEETEKNLGDSIYVNGTLYGTQAGRTDFAASDNGCRMTIECTGTPGADDYCLVKSIVYTPAE